MFKNLLIRILFWLIDGPDKKYADLNPKIMNQWLAESWQHAGFRAYLALRLRKLDQSLTGGVGMKEHPRDDYVRMMGQRFEHLRLMGQVKGAFGRSQAKRKAMEKEISKRKDKKKAKHGKW